MIHIKSLLIILSLLVVLLFAQFPANYTGTPYSGSPLNSQPQSIPGIVYLGYYDMGGEGVAYHDNDAQNSGAGFGNFRTTEGVDCEIMGSGGSNLWSDSTTKAVPGGKPYVGWGNAGEWLNLTVNIAEAGAYTVGYMMCYAGGTSVRFQRSLILDKTDTVGNVDLPGTLDWPGGGYAITSHK
jgi:hypothetical protein